MSSSESSNLSTEDKQTTVIEVERKFLAGDDAEERIVQRGGQLVREMAFRDSYYDTPDYQLTIGDCWLRRREGRWQMKYPPPVRVQGSSSGQYCETESEKQISDLLTTRLGLPSPSDDDMLTLTDVIKSKCQKFATFETHRKCYKLDDEVNVDLDTTEFGCCIGEVEVIIDGQTKLNEAVKKVDQVAEMLGFSKTPAEGKLEMYLRTRSKDHYALLVQKGIFQESP